MAKVIITIEDNDETGDVDIALVCEPPAPLGSEAETPAQKAAVVVLEALMPDEDPVEEEPGIIIEKPNLILLN